MQDEDRKDPDAPEVVRGIKTARVVQSILKLLMINIERMNVSRFAVDEFLQRPVTRSYHPGMTPAKQNETAGCSSEKKSGETVKSSNGFPRNGFQSLRAIVQQDGKPRSRRRPP